MIGERAARLTFGLLDVARSLARVKSNGGMQPDHHMIRVADWKRGVCLPFWLLECCWFYECRWNSVKLFSMENFTNRPAAI